MSVIGLVGTSKSGQSTFADILVKHYGYYAIDMRTITDYRQLGNEVYSKWDRLTIIHHITSSEQLINLRKRSYFHTISLDAGILVRFQRQKMLDLEQFVQNDDKQQFETPNFIDFMKQCKVKLSNNFQTIEEFQEYIKQNYDKINRPFRPEWDIYFLKLAYTIRQRSGCSKKAAGALLVDKHQRILSTSYNGTARKMKNCIQGGCDVCKESDSIDLVLYKCMCIHAEEGCILEQGMTHTRGSTLYTTIFPCVWCCKALLQAGVQRIVYGEKDKHHELAVEFLENLIKHEQIDINSYIY